MPYAPWEGVELPSATLQMFERRGHQPFVEESDRFTESLIEWMGVQ